jgi:hypothetical protein
MTEHMAQKSIDRVESTNISSEDDKESSESDYEEDNDKLEEAQKEEEAGEITTNEVF